MKKTSAIDIFGTQSYDLEKLSKMVIDFSKIVPFLKNYSEKEIDSKVWKSIFGGSFSSSQVLSNITEKFDINYLSKLTGPSDNEWNFFLNGLSKVLNFEILSNILSEYELDVTKQINKFSEEIIVIFSHIISLLSKLCQKEVSQTKLVGIFANYMLPYQFFQIFSDRSERILIISQIKFSPSFLQTKNGWAILSSSSILSIYDENLEICFEGEVENIQTNKNKVKFNPKNILQSSFSPSQKEISFTLLDENNIKQWSDAASGFQVVFFDSFKFINHSECYPLPLLHTIFCNLFIDDLLIMQSLVRMKYDSLYELNSIFDSLITLSISSQKIDVLLSYVTFDEISSVHDENLILRCDSPCSHLFSVYYNRYAQEYINNILKPLIIKITFMDVENLKDPNTDAEIVFDFVSLIADSIISNFDQIPLQIRHLATHIYNATKCCFGTRISTLRSITSFFVLRFLIPFIASPNVSEIMEITPTQLSNLLIPFGSIFHEIFSCISVPKKYPYLDNVKDKILNEREKYLEFFASLPINGDEKPFYKMPTNEEVNDASKHIIDTILTHKESFFSKYDELSRDPERIHPLSYRMVDFICSCFEKNIN